MASKVNLRLPAAILIMLGLMLALAAPAAAAPGAPSRGSSAVLGGPTLSTGVICGSATTFTGAGGSLAIAGAASAIDAAATISAEAAAALGGTLPLTTCLDLVVDATTGNITSIAIAAGGQLCGTVTATGTGAATVFTVGGAALPATLTADAALNALLTAAAQANADVCVDVTVDATTGAVTVVANVDATFTLCGDVTATVSGSGTVYTVAGLTIPAGQLSAAEAAALQLALTNDTTACVDLVIVDSVITSATVTADVCVTVSAVSSTSVTLDGVVLPLGADATVPAEVRAGANLGLRIVIDASDGSVTLDVITLDGCTQSGTEGGGGTVPDTATDTGSVPAPFAALAAILAALAASALLRKGVSLR